MTVYKFRPMRLSRSTHRCAAKLLELAQLQKLRGIAFVGYLEDGFIADACGEAFHQPEETKKMLEYLKRRLDEGHGVG